MLPVADEAHWVRYSTTSEPLLALSSELGLSTNISLLVGLQHEGKLSTSVMLRSSTTQQCVPGPSEHSKNARHVLLSPHQGPAEKKMIPFE